MKMALHRKGLRIEKVSDVSDFRLVRIADEEYYGPAFKSVLEIIEFLERVLR